MNRIALLLLPALCCAVEVGGWQTDHPEAFYDPTVSHHAEHFALMGAPIGIIGYTGLRILGANRPWAWVGGTVGAGVYGLAYEVQQSKDGAYKDPVDAAYSLLGGMAGAGLAWTTETYVIQPMLSRDSAGLAFAWRF